MRLYISQQSEAMIYYSESFDIPFSQPPVHVRNGLDHHYVDSKGDTNVSMVVSLSVLVNSSKCLLHQTYNLSTGECTCEEGWSGPNCRQLGHPCGLVPRCLNGGECLDGRCRCELNYKGVDCSVSGRT